MNSGNADQLPATGDQNSQLKQFFRESFSAWKEFYDRTDPYARIYQERRATAITFIDELDRPRDRLCWMWDADRVSRQPHLRARVMGCMQPDPSVWKRAFNKGSLQALEMLAASRLVTMSSTFSSLWASRNGCLFEPIS